MPLSNNVRGILCMVMAAITFVSCDSFLKLMLVEVPPLQALVLRGISAAVWCVALLAVMGMLRELPRAFEFWTIMRSLTEAVAVTAFIIALAKVPMADITAIYQIAPLIVLVGASLFWGETVGTARWFLIALGLVGALVIAQPGRSETSAFALLGIITAIASAARDLLSRRVPNDVPGLVITLTVILMVLAVSTVNTMLFETWVPVTSHTWLYSIGSGFFVMLGHLFVFMAFRLASARAVAPFYYSMTVCAVLFGAVLFGEWPNTLAFIGIAMIIGCGLGVLLMEKREQR
jgi:drug/metabolite transporter (DMT)-like permease